MLVIALVPGWSYRRLNEPLEPARSRTQLEELLEVVAVGLLTTGVSVAALLLVPDVLPERWMPDERLQLAPWAARGPDYLAAHPQAALTSGILVMAVSLGLAYAGHWFRRHHKPKEFVAANVWASTLGTRPKTATHIWAGVQITDGPLVEGILHSLDLDDASQAGRDLGLVAPIYVTEPNGSRELSPLDRVVMPESRIAHIGVIHLTLPAQPVGAA